MPIAQKNVFTQPRPIAAFRGAYENGGGSLNALNMERADCFRRRLVSLDDRMELSFAQTPGALKLLLKRSYQKQRPKSDEFRVFI